MTVSFDIPFDLEKSLQLARSDMSAQAKEAFLVSLYRQRKISHLALSQGLNLDRFETEAVLHKHQVTEDLGTLSDYLADVQTLEEFRTAPQR